MNVFCIGLNKTGTRSLHDALQVLGLSSLHWGGPERGPQIRALVEAAAREGRPLLEQIDDVDAYSDILALSTNFDLLDEQYPGSKFILTVRSGEAWLDSRRRHVEANIERKERGEYAGAFLTIDPDAWAAEMDDHVTRARSHFTDRPNDLLVMDIAAGDGWAQLCPFLGRPVPNEPFPRRG